VLRRQLRGCHNDWVFTDVAKAEVWGEAVMRAHEESSANDAANKEKAAEEEAMRKLREKWMPMVEDAILAITDDAWLDDLMDHSIQLVAEAILVDKVKDFAAAENEKREKAAKLKAEEEAKSKARDEMAQRKAKEKADRERKQKAMMAEQKKMMGF